ncbi:hypothetical protein [Arthrobacter sp. Br18]|uniref:hypothetical protein n=1 Tax=Arthrobacter sp. Br18 TaxID=1312954 RepID=UPI000479AC1C|nr:hypothetical protein [Arthrobacter sp. Br18]
MTLSLWIPTAAAAGLLALGAAAPSVAAGPPAAESPRATAEATDDHHGMNNQDSVPGMAQRHELMTRDNPGMKRMHEQMMNDNPGMARMHEQMIDADSEMGPNGMMPSSPTPTPTPTPTDEGEL